MSVQNEVEWLLDTIRDQWPGGIPERVALRNRDEPETRYPNPTWAEGETTEREQGVSLDRWIPVGVSTGNVVREIYGTTPQYRVETVLDVRIEAKPATIYGEAEDVNDFDTLVAHVQEAIATQTTYPEVDPTADSVGFVTYLDARLENESRLSRENKDYYRTDFSVRLRGNQQTPTQT